MILTGEDLTIVVPLWRRTQYVERVYESARAATPDAEVVFVVSGDDPEVEHAAVGLPGWTVMVDWPGGSRGDYARKINAGYRFSTRAWIFTGADDVLFPDDWYDLARAAAVRPDGGSYGVVGTKDGTNNRTMDGRHSTHSLVARWYADLGGSIDAEAMIYHEGYWHTHCDDELVETARSRGQYVHSEALVDHVHMLRDPALDDEVYEHGRRAVGRDRSLFRARRPLWGGPNPNVFPGQRPAVRRR